MARVLLAAGVRAAGDPEVSPELGSPGILGFVFTFLLALALVGLALLLVRQLRRVDRRAAALPPDPFSTTATSEQVGALTPGSSDVSEGRAATSEQGGVRAPGSSDAAGGGEGEGRRERP